MRFLPLIITAWIVGLLVHLYTYDDAFRAGRTYEMTNLFEYKTLEMYDSRSVEDFAPQIEWIKHYRVIGDGERDNFYLIKEKK